MSDKESFATINQVHEPKSPVGGFVLPCGYIGADGKLYSDVIFNEITGREEDVLVSATLNSAQKVSALIAGCMSRLGPFEDKTQHGTVARGMTAGDRVFSLFCLRRISLGDDYPIEETCPSCKHKAYYEQDLSTLDVRPMKTPMQRVYETRISRDRVASYHVLTGVDEERAATLKNFKDQATLAVFLRLEAIDGKPATLEDVKNLSLRDRNTLRESFEEVEGGVDTSLEFQCEACGHEYEKDLDIQRGFFFPSQTRRASKTRSTR